MPGTVLTTYHPHLGCSGYLNPAIHTLLMLKQAFTEGHHSRLGDQCWVGRGPESSTDPAHRALSGRKIFISNSHRQAGRCLGRAGRAGCAP